MLMKSLPQVSCGQGDQGKFGFQHQLAILNVCRAISRRIHFGKFVAENKISKVTHYISS